MKKHEAIFLTLLVVVAACSKQHDPVSPVSVPGVTTESAQSNGNGCFDLIAGRYTVAGTVCIDVDAEREVVEITYATSGNWQLEKTHVWVGFSLRAVPLTRMGNPKIGRFPYESGDIAGTTSWSVEVPVSDLEPRIMRSNGNLCGVQLYVAAHADVRRSGTGETEVEGAWCDGTRFTDTGNWGMYVDMELAGEFCASEAIVYTSDYASDSFDIWMVNPDGSKARRLASSPLVETRPVISRSGTHVAYLRWDGSTVELVTHELVTGNEKVVYASNDRVIRKGSLAYFPEDTEILLSRNLGGNGQPENYEVFAVDVATGATRNITNTPGFNEGTGDVDENLIVFTRDTNGRGCSICGELFTVPVGGGPEQQITNVSGSDGEARIFDDRDIVFGHHAPGGGVSIARVQADGTGYAEMRPGEFPDWSPDGRRIVFIDEGKIWIMERDGSGVTPIVEMVADHRDTYWGVIRE